MMAPLICMVCKPMRPLTDAEPSGIFAALCANFNAASKSCRVNNSQQLTIRPELESHALQTLKTQLLAICCDVFYDVFPLWRHHSVSSYWCRATEMFGEYIIYLRYDFEAGQNKCRYLVCFCQDNIYQFAESQRNALSSFSF